MITNSTLTKSASRLNIFLSYCTVEAKFSDILKDHLIQDFIGLVEVFLASDATSIPAGSYWLEEVVKGLRQAQLQIIICSNSSMNRPWIHYEAGAARVQGITIVPMCHSGLNPDQLPVPLSESEGLILTEARGVEKLYLRIAGLIGSFVPSVDFEGYAGEFQALEKELKAQRESIGTASTDSSEFDSLEPELIQNPQVLCVTSPQFRELGFANQLQIKFLMHFRRISSM